MLLALIVIVFLLLPVRITLRYDGGSLTVKASVAGLSRTLLPAKGGASRPTGGVAAIVRLRRNRFLRRLIRADVRLCSLQALIRPGFDNAALTAVFTAGLRGLAAALPRQCDVRVQPVFYLQGSVQAQCILRVHLGTIILVAALWRHTARACAEKEA